jgi:hypothetical protein
MTSPKWPCYTELLINWTQYKHIHCFSGLCEWHCVTQCSWGENADHSLWGTYTSGRWPTIPVAAMVVTSYTACIPNHDKPLQLRLSISSRGCVTNLNSRTDTNAIILGQSSNCISPGYIRSRDIVSNSWLKKINKIISNGRRWILTNKTKTFVFTVSICECVNITPHRHIASLRLFLSPFIPEPFTYRTTTKCDKDVFKLPQQNMKWGYAYKLELTFYLQICEIFGHSKNDSHVTEPCNIQGYISWYLQMLGGTTVILLPP